MRGMEADVMREYRTADFPTICALAYLNFETTRFERDYRSSERVAAFFEQTDELEKTLQALRKRELRVEPLAFLELTRTVKAQLRDCA